MRVGVRVAAVAVTLVAAVLTFCVVGAVAVTGQSPAACGTPSPVAVPPGDLSTGRQMAAYLESQGLSAVAAAGIVGNLEQESGLNPAEGDGAGGGGLAQWGGSWYAAMTTYAISQGLSPVSARAQLMFIVYGLQTNAGGYINHPGLLAALNSAPDATTAATMFETGYEECSGVTGWMSVTPGSLCNDPHRREFASAVYAGPAAGAPTPVSAPLGGCAQPVFAGGSGLDPIPGFTPGRDDDGVDGRATPGMPIFAPGASTLVEVLQGWYAGQPLLLFRFDSPDPSWPSAYWYIAEQITPVTEQTGTRFAARQEVATYAPAGTRIEIGWGSPTTNSRTLAAGAGAGAASGALTSWGESFKSTFGIPWVGQSP